MVGSKHVQVVLGRPQTLKWLLPRHDKYSGVRRQAPGKRLFASSTHGPAAPVSAHGTPDAESAWKGLALLVIVGLLGFVAYLLTRNNEIPTPMAAPKPPVFTVTPIVRPGAAGEPPPVEATPPLAVAQFRDALSSGGEGPELVVLPAGSFRMGCVSGRDCNDDEQPVHEVRINRPIAMTKYEVTFADYDRYAQAAGKTSPTDQGWGRSSHPVMSVDWEDAQGYAKWLSQQTGKPYRLPSEAEWEYAARAGASTAYSWGNSISCSQARYGRRDKGECSNSIDGTLPVGSFSANAWGLHDMHGNVWEWVQDCYHPSYAGATQDGAAWRVSCDVDDSGTSNRAMRGGSWFTRPGQLRSANRSGHPPSARYDSVGFRLVRRIDA